MDKNLKKVIYKLSSALQDLDELKEIDCPDFKGDLKRKTLRFFSFFESSCVKLATDLYQEKQWDRIVHKNLDKIGFDLEDKGCEVCYVMLSKMKSALADLDAIVIKELEPTSEMFAGPLDARLRGIFDKQVLGKYPHNLGSLLETIDLKSL